MGERQQFLSHKLTNRYIYVHRSAALTSMLRIPKVSNQSNHYRYYYNRLVLILVLLVRTTSTTPLLYYYSDGVRTIGCKFYRCLVSIDLYIEIWGTAGARGRRPAGGRAATRDFEIGTPLAAARRGRTQGRFDWLQYCCITTP